LLRTFAHKISGLILVVLPQIILMASFNPVFAASKDSICLIMVFNDTSFLNISGFNKLKSDFLVSDALEIKNILLEQQLKFQKKGFLEYNVDSLVSSGNINQAYVHVGKQYVWGVVQADSCDEQLAVKILNKYSIINKPVNIRNFNFIESSFVDYYENRGYPFTKVSFKRDPVALGNTLAGTFLIDRYKQIVIDSFIIQGKAKISPAYVSQYLGIKKGDLFANKEIQEIDSKLNQLRFVRVLKPSQLEFVNNTADIYLYIDKKKANRFNGLIGFLPESEETGKLLITGSLDLYLINSLGRGDELFISWNKTETNSQKLAVGVSYPYLFNTFLGISGSFKLFRQDTLYQNISPNVALQILYSGNNYIKLFYNYQATSIISTSGLEELIVLPTYADMHYNAYGLGWYHAKFDNPVNPFKGFFAQVEASYGDKEIIKNSKINEALYDSISLKTNQLKISTGLEYFQPIWKGFVFAIRNSSGILQNQNLFENELFRLGGVNDLRGFDDESIYASAYTIFNFELRYLFAKNSHVMLFFDQAYYQRKLYNTPTIDDTPFGFGAGINFDTKSGILSLSYALGKQFDNPINMKNGKIHIGYISQF
jgi:outer membrane protein assembly factor BamA